MERGRERMRGREGKTRRERDSERRGWSEEREREGNKEERMEQDGEEETEGERERKGERAACIKEHLHGDRLSRVREWPQAPPSSDTPSDDSCHAELPPFSFSSFSSSSSCPAPPGRGL